MTQAYKICCELLLARNYIILEKLEDKIIALKPDGQQIIVFFSDVNKFNVKNIQVYITLMNELNIFHAIIIYKNGVTAFTQKAIEQSIEMKFELFAEEDLQYNITTHRLQPIFEILNETQSVYDYQKGDLIKIIRKNGYITYRIVK
jgi:hypothetical protein